MFVFGLGMEREKGGEKVLLFNYRDSCDASKVDKHIRLRLALIRTWLRLYLHNDGGF